MRLLGPRPLDATAAERAARALLSAYGTDPASIPAGDGREPGLYLVVDDDGALRGFWLTVSDAWIEDGPQLGRLPPYGKALLDALTEEVWWDRFAVAPRHLGAWRPVVVLEWPPALADRSALPPPGVPSAEPDDGTDERGLGDEPTGWLEPEDGERPSAPKREATRSEAWLGLPPERSTVAIVRGSLRYTRSVHEGRYELVCLPSPAEEGLGVASMPAEWRKGLPLDEWLSQAATAPSAPPSAHQLGHPLQLPGSSRVGFPLTGWLTRDLELSPPVPAEAQVGVLVPRDTRSQLLGQTVLSVSVTGWLLIGTLGFSATAHWLAEPRLESETPPIAVDAQPALSVCSADHRRFVEQLRCQVRHLADGGAPGDADCSVPDPGDDLQAAYCALRDRGDAGGGYDGARTAAAQACFEVLGTPFEYADRDRDGVASPARLLDDASLQVRELAELTTRLDGVCQGYRERIEAKVAGAVLASHVGGKSGEAAALQDAAFSHARTGRSDREARCLEAGRRRPLDDAAVLEGFCGADPSEAVASADAGWRVLAGTAPADRASALGRYERARFLGRDGDTDLWRCHQRLRAGASGARPAKLAGRWDVEVPLLRSYADRGVTDQVELDALLLAIREDGAPSDACFGEVNRMLASYVPVHPLTGAADAGGWPSDQQRVCAQACAAAYHVIPPSPAWVTLGADLGRCVDASPPPEKAPHRYHEGRLDALRLPWNQDRDGGWVRPDVHQVCAFNLVAQELLPGVLPAEVAGPLWAGELAGRTGIAGGPDGAAAAAADALSKYGRNRSASTCGEVAAQCFTAELLRVMADDRLGPHQWRDAWSRAIAELPRRSADELADRPWCRLVRPYVSPDGRLPEGQLDLPCAMGVDETRQRVVAVVDRLASGALAQARTP